MLIIIAFSKIAASYKAAHKRYKLNSVINACFKTIGWAVINFAGSENVLQHNLKGLVPII